MKDQRAENSLHLTMGTTSWGAMQTFNLGDMLHTCEAIAVIRCMPHIARNGTIDMIQEVDRYGKDEVCQIMKIVITEFWMGRSVEEWDDMHHLEHLRRLEKGDYEASRRRMRWLIFWGTVALAMGTVWGFVADWLFKRYGV